jgi:hypothetical protein
MTTELLDLADGTAVMGGRLHADPPDDRLAAREGGRAPPGCGRIRRSRSRDPC